MSKRRTISSDAIASAKLWPIWTRMGRWDVRRQYKRSSIGVAWIFFQLSITITAVGLVYGKLLGQDMSKFIPALTIGLVVWNYLTSSIVSGGNAFISSEGYIKQIGLPIYVYVLRFFTSVTITSTIGLLAFFAVALVFQLDFSFGVLWSVIGFILLAITALLFVTLFAHLNARYRDSAHLASTGMGVLFYVTPIIWPAELLIERAEALAWIVYLNPFYHLVEVVRYPLLFSEPALPINYLFAGFFVLLLAIATIWLSARYHRRIVYYL